MKETRRKNSLSSFQTLIVSTATRVGMEIWSVLLRQFRQAAPVRFLDVGDSNYQFHQQLLLKRHWHSFIKKKIRCGGYRGGPAYYIHAYVEEKQKEKTKW